MLLLLHVKIFIVLYSSFKLTYKVANVKNMIWKFFLAEWLKNILLLFWLLFVVYSLFVARFYIHTTFFLSTWHFFWLFVTGPVCKKKEWWRKKTFSSVFFFLPLSFYRFAFFTLKFQIAKERRTCNGVDVNVCDRRKKKRKNVKFFYYSLKINIFHFAHSILGLALYRGSYEL